MDIYRELYPKVRPAITGPYKCKPSPLREASFLCGVLVLVIVGVIWF